MQGINDDYKCYINFNKSRNKLNYKILFMLSNSLQTYFCLVISFPLDCVDPDDVTDVTLALGDPDGDFAGSISGSR